MEAFIELLFNFFSPFSFSGGLVFFIIIIVIYLTLSLINLLVDFTTLNLLQCFIYVCGIYLNIQGNPVIMKLSGN